MSSLRPPNAPLPRLRWFAKRLGWESFPGASPSLLPASLPALRRLLGGLRCLAGRLPPRRAHLGEAVASGMRISEWGEGAAGLSCAGRREEEEEEERGSANFASRPPSLPLSPSLAAALSSIKGKNVGFISLRMPTGRLWLQMLLAPLPRTGPALPSMP